MPRPLPVQQGYKQGRRTTLHSPAPQPDENAVLTGESAAFDTGVSSKKGRSNHVTATGRTASGAELSK